MAVAADCESLVASVNPVERAGGSLADSGAANVRPDSVTPYDQYSTCLFACNLYNTRPHLTELSPALRYPFSLQQYYILQPTPYRYLSHSLCFGISLINPQSPPQTTVTLAQIYAREA